MPDTRISSIFAHLAYSPAASRTSGGSSLLARRSAPSTPLKAQRPLIDSVVDSDDLDGPLAALPSAVKRSPSSGQSPLSPKVKIESQPDPPTGSFSSSCFAGPKKSPHHQSSRKRKASSSIAVAPSTQKKPAKRKAVNRPYADPDAYSYLSGVADNLAKNLDVLFCGINPGVSSAQKGHHYAGPTNRFWKILHESGFTPTRLLPQEDATLPARFNLGLTNLVSRPTASSSELSPARDMRAGVPALLDKIAEWRPRVVCFVGKEIAKEFEFVLRTAHPDSRRKGKQKADMAEKEATDGMRAWRLVHLEEVEGSRETVFWTVSSTSGLVRDSMETRLTQWRTLKAFVHELKDEASPVLEHKQPALKNIDLAAVQATVKQMERTWAERALTSARVKVVIVETEPVEKRQEEENNDEVGG